MKFQSLVVLGLVLITALASGAVASGGSELLRLLSSPFGRFVLEETRAGSSLSKAILSASGGAREMRGEISEAVLARLLGSKELVPLRQELEIRLSRMESELKLALAVDPALDAEAFLAVLVQREIRFSIKQGNKFVFARSASAQESNFVVAKEAFLKGESAEAAAGAEAAGAKSKKLASLAVADLSGKAFPNGAVFPANTDFRFAGLRGLESQGVVLDYARMQWADLREVKWIEPSLHGADLSSAQLRGARLKNVSGDGAILVNTNADGLVISGSLRGADLRGAKWAKANLKKPFFHGNEVEDWIAVDLKGALFNKDTSLPFSHEEAERIGMIFVAE